MIERVELGDGYTIPRIIVGGWQLSSGHSAAPADRDQLLAALGQYADAGLSTFDCADIYGGVEQLLGEFRDWYRNKAGAEQAARIQVHTKFVPDRDELPRISRVYVERIIDRSLRRLRVERLDLVQFHWWDLDVPGYVETAGWLDQSRQSGKIRHLGATNFDSPRLAELLDGGVKVATHQVQYSLLDRRPETAMLKLCARYRVQLLCYGTVAGGFLSERYLGSGEPASLPNRSLVKYRLIIDEFGGWAAFQELLEALSAAARKHEVGVANVAMRWVLDRPQVGAAIVGAHDASHLEQNLKAFSLKLDSEDRRRIEGLLDRHSGPSGDVYHLERDGAGKHAAIMRYNLNREG